MNYNNWIIPIILLLLLGGFFFGHHLQKLFTLEKRWKKIAFWVGNYGLVIYIVLARNIFCAFLLHAVILFLLYDFILLIMKQTKNKKWISLWERFYFHGIFIFALSFLATLYGFYNAYHSQIRSYQVSVSKKMEENITIGMLSDLHLGTVYSASFFDHLVSSANEMEADIFVLDGDIFDEFTSRKLKQLALKRLQEIDTKYGVYYIEGNHDLLDASLRKKVHEANLFTLEDEVKIIQDRICLIGRKDYRRVRLKEGRTDLATLVSKCPSSLPIVVLDHQPEDDSLGKKLGVDLQLSGHTHAGQFFPANFFLKNGLYKKDNYHLIVSSGYGAWNIPIRTAGHSEMVKVELKGIS